MSEKTIQNYRHEVRSELQEGRDLLALRSASSQKAYHLINGPLTALLEGREGLTQEEQVEKLSSVRDSLTKNIAELPEAIASAKAEVEAQIGEWEEAILAHAQAALATVTIAAEFAASRDFEAHQETKRERRDAPVNYCDGETCDGDCDE